MRSLMVCSHPVLFRLSNREKWDGRGVYRVLVGKPEDKRRLGRPRRRWENRIKMAVQEVGCEGMDWIDLAQDRNRWRALVAVIMNLRVP